MTARLRTHIHRVDYLFLWSRFKNEEGLCLFPSSHKRFKNEEAFLFMSISYSRKCFKNVEGSFLFPFAQIDFLLVGSTASQTIRVDSSTFSTLLIGLPVTQVQ